MGSNTTGLSSAQTSVEIKDSADDRLAINADGSINVTETNPATPTNRTASIASGGHGDSSGTITIGTVPANKVWRIVGLSLGLSPRPTNRVQADMRLNGTIVMGVFVGATQGTAGMASGGHQSITFNYENAPVLTAGQTVQCNLSGTNSWSRAVAFYVQEDA